MSREDFVKMSEESIEATKKRMDAANKELKSTESIRGAWDRAKGVFNEVWKRLENIGRALLISIGEPILNILVPAMDKLGKALTWVVEIFQGFGEGEKKLIGIAAVLGTIANVLQSGLGWILKTALPWLIGTALPAIATFAATYLLPVFLAIGAAIAAAVAAAVGLVTAFKALADWGGALMDGLAPALEKIWGLLKIIGTVALAILMPWLVLVAALIKHWNVFVDAFRPAIKELKIVWGMITEMFKGIGKSISDSFGIADDKTVDFFSTVSSILKVVAKVMGTVVKWGIRLFTALVAIFSVLVALSTIVLGPIFAYIGGIYDVLMGVVDAFVDVIDYVKEFFSLLSEGKFVEAFTALSNAFQRMFVGVIEFVVDGFLAIINTVLKTISMLPGLGGIGPIEWNISESLGLASGGITKEDNVPAVLHKDEAIIPLEKFPEIVGSTVYIEQEMVVDELKRVRAVLDRIARKGGLASAIQR